MIQKNYKKIKKSEMDLELKKKKCCCDIISSSKIVLVLRGNGDIFMKKYKSLFKKIYFIMVLSVCLIFSYGTVSAAGNSSNSFWSQASDWYSGGSTNTFLDESVLSDIANLVEVAGTAVIAIATVVIGVKYILGSVTEKASAKENLITLLVACVFFFGWSNIRGLLIKNVDFTNSGTVSSIDGNSTLFVLENTGTSIDSAFKSVFGIVLTVAQIIAILCTAYMGVKYILSGGEGKAKLKEKSITYVIGIIMIFTALNFIRFISSAINGMF